VKLCQEQHTIEYGGFKDHMMENWDSFKPLKNMPRA